MIKDYFAKSSNVISKLASHEKKINEIVKKIISCHQKKGKILVAGNGGSCSDAEHFVGELVCTYKSPKRKPISAISIASLPAAFTAWSNDFEFSSVFSRQIEALSPNIGLSIGLSTSGKSENVINALKLSNSLDIKTVLISGDKCPKHDFVKKIFRVPSDETSIIQTVTQIMYHSICNELEKV